MQTLKGLPDGRAAEADLRAQLLFAQPFTGGKRAVEDAGLDRLVGKFGGVAAGDLLLVRRHHSTAIGLTGEPVAVFIRSGAIATKNSHRLLAAHCSASSSRF